MNMHRFFVICFSICSCISNLYSQVDTTELIIRRLAQRYHNEKLLHYDFKVEQYDSTDSKVLNYTEGQITKSKNLMHMNYNDVEVVLHDSLMLYVNYSRKEMFIKKLSKAEFDTFSSYTIDKYLMGIKSQKVKIKQYSKNENSTVFAMVFQNLSDNLYTFTLDDKTGYITDIRIDYYMDNEVQIIENRVMKMKYFNYKVLNEKDYNPSSKFLVKDKTGWIVKEDYKNFKLRRL